VRLGVILATVAAIGLHAGFLLFGGIFLPQAKEDHGTLQEVELLDDAAATEEKEKDQEKPKEESDTQEELDPDAEPPPDAEEILRNLELATPNDAPALEAASLAAIEQALSGQAGSGAFADALTFSSGGRIGGTGKAGALDEKVESAFSMGEIDQKPRAIFQAMPLVPAEMRGKKVVGVVTITFVVDAAGKVSRLKVEKASHPAFEKPALDALKQWKFEPAVRGGQRVGCKMRLPVKFPAS